MDLKEFASKVVPGRLIYARIAGSHCYNLNTPVSDVDFFGIYQASTLDILSLRPPTETLTAAKPDFTIHEIGKFCELLVKGNPVIAECLFADAMVLDNAWDGLKRMRMSMMSGRTVKQYLGYSQGQLRKMSHKDYSPKYGMHVIRLLTDAENIALGRELVLRKDGEERKRLMSIRNGEWTQEAVERLAYEMIDRIDGMKPWKVPDEPDVQALSQWLVNLRIANLTEQTAADELTKLSQEMGLYGDQTK